MNVFKHKLILLVILFIRKYLSIGSLHEVCKAEQVGASCGCVLLSLVHLESCGFRV